MVTRHKSFCRTCTHSCAVVLDVEDNHIVRIIGDQSDPVYRGYSCVKGREHRRLYAHPDRVTQPLKRCSDGSFVQIDLDDAIGEIAERLKQTIDRHGPKSVGLFWGSPAFIDNPVTPTMIDAFMTALGSRMKFDSASVDQPGKVVAKGFHGVWMAPNLAGVISPEVILLIGNNPLVSHQAQVGVPTDLHRNRPEAGGLIVVDPRQTETAKKAKIHLQPKPGYDAAILAGIIRVILAEGLHDQNFVEENVSGLERLRAAVDRFDPHYVADVAGIDADDLVAAARLFGRAQHAYAAAGTGANMTGDGTLVEYLILCLETIQGRRTRAGTTVINDAVLTPLYAVPVKAQALDPFPAYGLGEPLPATGLHESLAGYPGAALADEILNPRGGIRALLSTGGNPASCLPNQEKTVRAFESLELLVQTDIEMTATARLADYIIPGLLPYEMAGATIVSEFLGLYTSGLGNRHPYAQYTPPIVEPPDGSQCEEQWKFFFRLADKLGLHLDMYPAFGSMVPGGTPTRLDTTTIPSSDDMFDIVFSNSRIPWRDVRDARNGMFPGNPRVVEPKDPEWTGRLEVGHPEMMNTLDATTHRVEDPDYPFRMTCRRTTDVMNTPNLAKPPTALDYNPAKMHPDDLHDLGIEIGGRIRISTANSSIVAVVAADDTIRRGIVSISHLFGGLPDRDHDVATVGTSVNWLLSDQAVDPFSGQPQMTNVPVRITAVPTAHNSHE